MNLSHLAWSSFVLVDVSSFAGFSGMPFFKNATAKEK
jgi:hypothetical protein